MTRHYLLRQPATLESEATDKLALWIGAQASELTSALQTHAPHAADAALSRHIARVRACLQCNVPRRSHDKLMSQTITQLYLLGLLDPEAHTAGRMVEALFTDYLTSLSLSFDQFKMFRVSLRSKSHLLTGLVHLDLDFDRSDFANCYSEDFETDVIQLLEQLHSLKRLTIKTLCSYKVLRCIIKNCTLIEELHLNAYQISDGTINMLTQLRNLRIITINTAVRCNGTKTLLLSCKNIEHISINEKMYYYDDNNRISHVVKQITSSKGDSGKRFNLKTYTSYKDTLEELQTVVRMCPLIQNLTVHACHGTRQNNIMAVIDLHELRELTLIGYGFYNGHVQSALQVVGGNLEHLQLLRVTQIDLNAMIDISQMCPNLESLSLEKCKFIDITTKELGQQTKEIDIPPFRGLNNLTLDLSSCLHSPDQPIDLTLHTKLTLKLMQEPAFFLLTNCLNVEYIEFIETFMLTEEIMLHFLDKNPLIYLKELKINQYSKILRSSSAPASFVIDRIVENCTNRPEVIQVLSSPRPQLLRPHFPYHWNMYDIDDL